MRDIRFRGKRVDNGEFVYGGYHKHIKRTPCPVGDNLQPDDIVHLIIESGFSDWNMPKPINAIVVNPESVGQFTGLLDKNGKEIYEGDLLQITRYPGENYYLEIAKSDDPPHNFICGYRKKPDADVRGISDGIFEILEEDLSDYEVVCNIYEHPNLLGGDQ